MRARQQNISIFASTIETLKALMRNEDYDIETFHSATSGEEGMEVEENGEAEKPMDVVRIRIFVFYLYNNFICGNF